ncbi:MAG: hypothetical protein M0R80_08595 [Proteobacteria bacterium]|jgi:hypothetical protein|nr:hypothetical protein [Pseudomonadota bacterium]
MQFKEWLARKTYYHGSFDKLPNGTILRPNPNYVQHWGKNSFYQILEKHRPPNMISHKNAVFMCDNSDDVGLAGGAERFIYAVQPLGPVQKHDLNWSSEISMLTDMLANGEETDKDSLKRAAAHYWRGDPHPNESVWEYLTTYAVIVDLVEEE